MLHITNMLLINVQVNDIIAHHTLTTHLNKSTTKGIVHVTINTDLQHQPSATLVLVTLFSSLLRYGDNYRSSLFSLSPKPIWIVTETMFYKYEACAKCMQSFWFNFISALWLHGLPIGVLCNRKHTTREQKQTKIVYTNNNNVPEMNCNLYSCCQQHQFLCMA